MTAQISQTQNPAVIARHALMEMVRMAIPPTPENYASQYRRAAGQPDHAMDESRAEELVAEGAGVLVSLAESVGEAAAGLTMGIERFGGDLKTIFGEVDQFGVDDVRSLVEALTASGLEMQKTIEASRSELEVTRKRLDQVTDELERSRALARVDPLTGLINRRGMDEVLRREIARARRSGLPLSVAIIDIDHFKRINDEYGHTVGDQALAHFATTSKAAVRESDVICRYGGEEFLIILPDTATQPAFFVVDRLRLTLDRKRFPINSGELEIRYSSGIAELCGNEDTDTLLKRADEAMYAAKRAGRNRVLVARQFPTPVLSAATEDA